MLVPIGREHVRDVATLHHRTLTGLLVQLGPAAIRAFYRGSVDNRRHVGFAWVADGVLLGFVSGSTNPIALRGEVLRAGVVRTLFAIGLGVLRRPSNLVWLWRAFREPGVGSVDAESPELTYLAVAEGSRGTGLGQRLVEAFNGEFRNRNVAAYQLSVDAQNVQAVRFYERLGFRAIVEYSEFGILHRRYQIDLGQQTPAEVDS